MAERERKQEFRLEWGDEKKRKTGESFFFLDSVNTCLLMR